MNEISDLLYTSLNAQFEYILNRYNSKEDLRNFENASQLILSCIDGLVNYNEVVCTSFTLDYEDLGFNNKPAQDCYELYQETKDLLMARFVTGRSTETYLERL